MSTGTVVFFFACVYAFLPKLAALYHRVYREPKWCKKTILFLHHSNIEKI